MSEPVRTCIGCRRKDAIAHMLRLVVRDGQVVVDRDARLPGRGARLHPACADGAIGAVPSALRTTLHPQAADRLRRELEGNG